MRTGPKPMPEAERFWRKVNKGGRVVAYVGTRCWEWTGGRHSSGYGAFGVTSPRRSEHAHRTAWRLTNGPVPPGLFVLHRCDNPPCVNPDHLFLGTLGDNNRDTASKGRLLAQKNPGAYSDVLARGRATLAARAAVRPIPPCIHCRRPARITRKGRCGTCHEYFRRHGADRPASILEKHRVKAELQGNE